LKNFAGMKKVRIFAARFGKSGKFIENIERLRTRKQVPKERALIPKVVDTN